MTKIWIVIDSETGEPIVAASSKEGAEQQLFEYMGLGDPIHEEHINYLGFILEEEGYPVGYYTFEYKYDWCTEWETSVYNLFCNELDAPQK